MATQTGNYAKSLLCLLPFEYSSADCSRITIIYFCLSALDLLGEDIGGDGDKFHKDSYSEFIRSLLLRYSDDRNERELCGFRGGTFAGNPFEPSAMGSAPVSELDRPNLAMTYAGLLSLIILNDFDLKSFKSADAILRFVSSLQQTDGSLEADVRFSFCAFAVCRILAGSDTRKWPIDLQKAFSFVKSCLSFDGGFAQIPGMESHGGSTYCALACFELSGSMDGIIPCRKRILKWLVNRQSLGFSGRVNKPNDTCYSFWIGSSLQILGAEHLVDKRCLESFLETATFKYGGYGKEPGDYPDALHTYLALAGMSIFGLSLSELPGLKPLYGALNLSREKLEILNEN